MVLLVCRQWESQSDGGGPRLCHIWLRRLWRILHSVLWEHACKDIQFLWITHCGMMPIPQQTVELFCKARLPFKKSKENSRTFYSELTASVVDACGLTGQWMSLRVFYFSAGERESEKQREKAKIFPISPDSHSLLACSTFVTGVYKSQEARLMLLLYEVKTSSHTTLSKLKEEAWSMDGFVSAFCLALIWDIQWNPHSCFWKHPSKEWTLPCLTAM